MKTLSRPGQRSLENPYATSEQDKRDPTILQITMIIVFFRYIKKGIDENIFTKLSSLNLSGSHLNGVLNSSLSALKDPINR